MLMSISRLNWIRAGATLSILLTAILLAPGGSLGADACLECHGATGLHDGEKALWLEVDFFDTSVHGRLPCADCHKQVGGYPHRDEMEVRCDLPCHVRDASHKAQWDNERGSAHARSGKVPCLNCHDAGSAARGSRGEILCTGCHSSLDSPNGLYPSSIGAIAERGHARARADGRAPTCKTCHGHHGIGSAEAARGACSTSGCHPDKPISFGAVFDHGKGASLKPWAGSRSAMGFIALFIAGILLLHSFRGERVRAEDGLTTPSSVEIFDPINKWIHILALAGGVFALATGPLLHFPSLAKSLGLETGLLSTFHGLFGFSLLGAWLLHLAKLCVDWLEGLTPVGLLPRPGDIGQFFKSLLWHLGVMKNVTPYGRFGYKERFSYGLFFLLVPTMAFTGFAMSNPGRLSTLLGPNGLMEAASIHLALGLLFVICLAWHIYFSLLQPGALWFNHSWITGRSPFNRVWMMRRGWAEEIVSDLNQGLEPGDEPVDESVSVEELLERGNSAALEGRYREAALHFIKALELYPGYSQALYNLGVSLYKSGDKKRAAIVLKKYLAQDEFGAPAPKARELIRRIEEEGGE
ncbi:MAG: hypothetical protein C0608_00135 [Deltaproteobacteria bacterium]|nr:MAG: hypothetical protein C0608_00135 [Deltaproteobacteria bacterium]